MERSDVQRVAHFICEPDAVETQTERFMNAFDPEGTGKVTLRQFLGPYENDDDDDDDGLSCLLQL